ncbi:hypothetical protein [Rosistilla oblonga]|uniref:hypothetical protein n=1 Tax=Rosistilla oblonga TaxID=2527990 RepID=UPI003A973480
MTKKKQNKAKSIKKANPKKKKASSEKKPSLTGSTSANFHEAGRSEYLAHFVFSSFGTSVPIPRQEDTGLDLHCTLGEREGQRLWPIASYSVQVKSNADPWLFADKRSIQWIVEHPLPVFLCVVDKKSASLSIYHTSPRFHIWVTGNELPRIEMIPESGSEGFGHPWGKVLKEDETPVIPDDGKFSLSAPIARFSIVEMLDAEFCKKIKQILRLWIESDRKNIFRIQAGTRTLETFSEYRTNVADYQRITTYSRNRVSEAERDQLLQSLVEQAKWLSNSFAMESDWQGFLYVEMLLRHLNALNYVIDGSHGYHLYEQLRKAFPHRNDSANSKFYSGLDGLSERIQDMTCDSINAAKQKATPSDGFMIDPEFTGEDQ